MMVRLTMGTLIMAFAVAFWLTVTPALALDGGDGCPTTITVHPPEGEAVVCQWTGTGIYYQEVGMFFCTYNCDDGSGMEWYCASCQPGGEES